MSAELIDTAEETIIDFITCPRCKKYIQPPSVCCERGHFMCYSCKFEDDECGTCGSTEFPNKSNLVFDRILREIYYPCVNQELGCSGFFKFDEIQDHQEECLFEISSCCFSESGCQEVMKLHEKSQHEAVCKYGVSCKLFLEATGRVRQTCAWRGRMDQLYDHVCTIHDAGWLPASTLQTNVTFAWMLPIQIDFEKTEFLRLEDVDEMFYFHVKCVQEGPQYLAVQHLGCEEVTSEYMYTVEFKNASKQIVFRDKVIPSGVDDVYKHPNCCTFHFEFLRHHFHAERVCDCYIRIYKTGQEETKGKRLLQFLGSVITEERDGCISNRESFQDKIEYRLESMELPDDPEKL